MSKGIPPLNTPVEAGYYTPEPPRAWPEGSFRTKRKVQAMHTPGSEWWPTPSDEYVQEQAYRSWLMEGNPEQGGFNPYGSNMTTDDQEDHAVGYAADEYQ